MKRTITICPLFILIFTILNNTTFAQFGAASGPVAEAINYGQSVNATSIANAQQFAVKSPAQIEAATANLHRKVFNPAPRDNSLEAQVASLIAPTLSKLNLNARIGVLVIQDDVIPYAHVSRDGVFVMTSCVARGMAGFRYAIGFLLREGTAPPSQRVRFSNCARRCCGIAIS